jgi:hypothetical protein
MPVLVTKRLMVISGGADANESSAANSLISRSVIYKPVEEINTTSSDSE